MKRFLTFFEVTLCTIALLSLVASFILPRLLQMRLERNEQVAEMNLKQVISPALENYAKNNNAAYPISEIVLLYQNPPYLKQSYSGRIIQGYKYSFDFSSVGYKVTATPFRCGPKGTGRTIYTVTTGGIFSETDCNGNGAR
ncbi:MAG: hypothetical protein PHU91_00165 [Candidatus Omnitrophica bacterium]|nr:hypothetical protein [Candidatus Omnitrophota bacterium]MDD5236076.1 hypothetical protein [Candidatus Omnitrophota bacterium]MDD5611044.1 hypothetical protein [Candidatus Omnitrophota bacterium]